MPGAEASHNSLRWATLKTSKDKRLRVMNVNLSRKDWMANYSRKQIKTENLQLYYHRQFTFYVKDVDNFTGFSGQCELDSNLNARTWDIQPYLTKK